MGFETEEPHEWDADGWDESPQQTSSQASPKTLMAPVTLIAAKQVESGHNSNGDNDDESWEDFNQPKRAIPAPSTKEEPPSADPDDSEFLEKQVCRPF